VGRPVTWWLLALLLVAGVTGVCLLFDLLG